LFDQSLMYAFPECRVQLLLRSLKNGREGRGLGDVSETGQLLQCRLRLRRQTDELFDHQVDHIVSVSLDMHAIEIPGPARAIKIKDEQFSFGERRNELNGEERIAACFLVHQVCEWRTASRLAAKRVRKQLTEMLPGQRSKRDLLYPCASTLDHLELPH